MPQANPVLNCLMNHRSIRKFKPDPVPEETIDTILQAGVRTATAGSIQPYAFIVIDEPALLKKISYIDGPLAIVAVVDQYRVRRYYELNDAPFYNNQAINLMISYWDATIALQNVVVAAESLGLGTVYIGMILSMNLQEVLGVPEHVMPAGLITLGFSDEEAELRPRLPLDAVVHRNGYQIPTDEDIADWYREGDEAWQQRFENEWSEERRTKFIERGVTNRAQHWTIGHYTEEFTRTQSKGVVDNIKRAGFILEEEADS
ncbi:nitroreductase family protein [Candidatus Bipolaricaulota bacterium]